MARTLRAGVLAIAVAAAFAAPASAAPYDPCAGEYTTTELAGFYIVDHNGGILIGGEEDSGTWIYQESNGVAGVQRGGDSPLGADLGGSDTPCQLRDDSTGELVGTPDTVIF